MFSIDELKNALSRMSETEIIYDADDEKSSRLKFRKNGELFVIYSLPENELSKTNLRLSRLVKLNKNKSMSKDDGEAIEASLNLTSSTPCKVVYVYNLNGSDLDSGFFITNVYSDKLDFFEKDQDEKTRISNAVILILGMIVEVISCNQEIVVMVDETAEKTAKAGGKDGE